MKTGSIEWTLERLAARVAGETFDIVNRDSMYDRWWRESFGLGWTQGAQFLAASDLREVMRAARFRSNYSRLCRIVREAIKGALIARKQTMARKEWPWGPIHSATA